MEYRVLGRTGLRVSAVGFGGAPAGLRNYLGQWEPADPQASEQIEHAIDRAVTLGINYFDTAPGYGGGLSETMFGRALKKHRERVVLATKLKATNAAETRRSVELSLERLQTDHLDLIQYHGGWYSDADVENILKPDGVLDGLRTLRAEGLVRSIGFTTEGVNGAVSQLIATDEFDTVMVCYNLIFQHPYDPSRHAGLMYEAEARHMGIVVMRPLTSGTFQKWLSWLDPGIENRVDLPKALLSFVLSNPLVDVAIVGMRTAGEVEANVANADDRQARIDLDELHTRYVG
ncbi:MAG TPA: aldo/keto reductase [Chloroflexota bacterium]|nr:aldo/keto reductase [Chloroflexota bacterium]